MADAFCVICSKIEDTLPNGEIIIHAEGLTFSICTKPQCHKKLSKYIYEMVDSSFIEVECKGKRYKFPMDKRIINSLPSKFQAMLAGEYVHTNLRNNGRRKQ